MYNFMNMQWQTPTCNQPINQSINWFIYMTARELD